MFFSYERKKLNDIVTKEHPYKIILVELKVFVINGLLYFPTLSIFKIDLHG